MSIQTVEIRFQYQAHEILKRFKKQYAAEQFENNYKGSFDDYLWDCRSDIGQSFIEAVDAWCGIEEATEKPY